MVKQLTVERSENETGDSTNPHKARKRIMRIATWPVDGVCAKNHYMLHWLHHRKPDIVCLQKIRASKEKFPYGSLCDAGYRAEVYMRFPKDYGVAVISRRELGNPQILHRGVQGQEDFGARLLTVKVGNLILSSIYVPTGNPNLMGAAAAAEIQVAWLRSMRNYVDDQPGASTPALLCGDFNVSDYPIVAKMEASRQLQLLSASGYVDLYRLRHPAKHGFTYGFDLHKSPTSRLSRIFGTKNVADALKCAWVDLKYRRPIPIHEELRWARSAPLMVDIAPVTVEIE